MYANIRKKYVNLEMEKSESHVGLVNHFDSYTYSYRNFVFEIPQQHGRTLQSLSLSLNVPHSKFVKSEISLNPQTCKGYQPRGHPVVYMTFLNVI